MLKGQEMNIHERIVMHAENLDKKFWKDLDKITNTFPDTSDAFAVSALIAQTASMSIVVNYILGYEKEYRNEAVSMFCENVKNVIARIQDQTPDK